VQNPITHPTDSGSHQETEAKLRRNKRDSARDMLMRFRSRQQPSDFHFNVVTSDPDMIGRNRERRRWADHLSGGYVENRPVLGTRYLVARQYAFQERTAAMGAGVVNGMESGPSDGRIGQFICHPQESR
jgi:hypothetical protein